MKMKPILTLAFILVAFTSYPQNLKKQFFNKHGEKTEEKNAYVYRFIEEDVMPDKKEVVDTYYFVKNDKVQSHQIKSDSSREGYIEYYENGNIKKVGRYEADMNIYRRLFFYPDGKLQMIRIAPLGWKGFFYFNQLILSYRDSTGTETVVDGEGFCKCYYFDGDSTVTYREEGKVVGGLHEGEWLTFRNDTLEYRDILSGGVFQRGIRYDNGSENAYTDLNVPPEFPGGSRKLHKFILLNLNYPRDAKRAMGYVYVKFVVETNGSITNIGIKTGISEPLDREAVRVVGLMPKWIPAVQRGKLIRMGYVTPISFGHLTPTPPKRITY